MNTDTQKYFINLASAPELLRCDHKVEPTKASDIWSIGYIIIEVVSYLYKNTLNLINKFSFYIT